MKKAIILIIFTCVFLSPAITNAQIDPMIGTTAEWTVAGTLLGVYGGLKFKDRIGFGALYESRTVKFDSRFNENLNFLGLYMDYRILREGKIDVDIFIRGGYSNNRFVVVVPSLNIEYFFSSRLSGFVMAGVRSEKPSVGFGLFYHFKKRKE